MFSKTELQIIQWLQHQIYFLPLLVLKNLDTVKYAFSLSCLKLYSLSLSINLSLCLHSAVKLPLKLRNDGAGPQGIVTLVPKKGCVNGKETRPVKKVTKGENYNTIICTQQTVLNFLKNNRKFYFLSEKCKTDLLSYIIEYFSAICSNTPISSASISPSWKAGALTV